MEERQASTLDDQKYGAEDGDQQALSLDDRKFAAEDGRPAGTDVRRSDARGRIWMTSRCRCPTIRRTAPKMEDQHSIRCMT